jgi:hypothetical protein
VTSPGGRGGPVERVNESAQRRKKKRGGLGAWFTSASGILASVATIVAAVASVLAAHQTARVDQLTIVVRQQQAQIKRAQLSTRSEQHGGTTATSGDTGGASLQGSDYLSALQPTVDNGDLGAGSQVMSAKPYPDSVTFNCLPASGGQPAEAFDVAGHTLFTAVVGIPDDTSDVTGVDETVTFSNQSGTRLMNPVTVSLGHPATVTLNITGVTQLAVTCTGINTQTQQSTNGNPITLGNAQIS